MRPVLILLTLLAASIYNGCAGIQTREITGKDGSPIVLVPAGEFQYGDTNQRVSLRDFYMDKYEVTTGRYAGFLQASGRKPPRHWKRASQLSAGDRPVIGVDWYDADAYCRHYGKRLPIEQEWEKAARGNDGRKYPWGNDEPTSRHANFGKGNQYRGFMNSYSDVLTAVGSYEDGKSPYGISDLAGNVWEWTGSDHDSKSKVLRGGSWFYNADLLRVPLRYWQGPRYRHFDIGFRCVQDKPE